jgi:predicted nucleic acid-binding protein
VVVPPLLYLELLNIAKKRWAPTELQLTAYAQRLLRLAFTVLQPDLIAVARWATRGLTAYDACYVALAEERRTTVVTADRQMLSVGGSFAMPLTNIAS